MTSTAPAPVFTPMNEDRTEKLEFPLADVEVVAGNPFENSRTYGKRGTIKVDGVFYDVFGESCGAACFCAARVKVVSGP